MNNIQSSETDTALTTVALPTPLLGRKRVINALLTLGLLVIAIAQFSRSEWLMGSGFAISALFSGYRFWRLHSAIHVRLKAGLLRSYDPHTGEFNSMPAAEIGSIQFRAGSDRNLIKLRDRFIVRHNRYERELVVFLLADEQKPKLEAFFQAHFPEQHQESVEPLPGFPLARE